jgi:tight adherence protein B
MTFAIATFVVSMLIMFGAYWALVLRPEQAGRSAAIGRLKGVREQVTTAGVVISQARLSDIPLFDQVLRRRQNLTRPLERLLTEAGMQMRVGTFLLMVVVAGLAGGVGIWVLTRLVFVSVGAGLLSATLPYLYVRRKRAVRLRTFEEQFPEAIDLISRALRAGHALTTGLGMVADEIPKPVGEEFRRLYDEQNFGMSLPDAMRAMARRVPVLDARFFVTAVLTQRESGGNLAEVLDNLGGVIRERFKVKRQVRVMSAHGRMTGWVLATLPPALAFAFMARSPDHFRILLDDPMGPTLIVAAILLQVIGTLIIRKLVNIEY